MSPDNACPRCGAPLEAGEDGGLRCATCCGVFLPRSPLRAELFADPEVGGASPRAALRCPGCGAEMRTLRIEDAEIDRCSSCGGVWMDAGEELTAASSPASLGRVLLFGLSLPERALRSAVGLGAGTVREMAELLVPQAFQSSRTYKIVVRNSLCFLTDDVGGAAPQEGGEAVQSDYMARKAVGNFVDLAGMATLHVSPLWMLAILSDVAYGTKAYVGELADELKAKGLIDETSTIRNADDILSAVESASGSTATLFDTPPLSVAQLRETLGQVRSAVASMDYRSILPEAELRKYWQEMRDVAKQENVSLLGVSAGLTLRTLQKVKTISSGALTGVQVAGGLFNRSVIGHYVGSLHEIQERGFYQTLKESYAPYVDALWRNFDRERSTATEALLSGRAIRGAFGKLASWLSGKGAKDAAPPVEPQPEP